MDFFGLSSIKNTLTSRIGKNATTTIFAALKASITEIGNFANEFATEANFASGGSIIFARNPGQATRLQAGEDADHRWLSKSELAEKILIADSIGALHACCCGCESDAALACISAPSHQKGRGYL